MTTFAPGDHVTLTRQLPNGRTYTTTGILTHLLHEDGQLTGARITGHDQTGRPDDSYADLDAARMLRLYGVTQTLRHA